MSAWPEAVYIIKKMNYSLDAMFDIDENGIQNINALNDRIDNLNNQINSVDPQGIAPFLVDIRNLLDELYDQIDDFQDLYDAVVAQLTSFENNLIAAEHRIVYIGTTAQVEDPSEYAVTLIVS